MFELDDHSKGHKMNLPKKFIKIGLYFKQDIDWSQNDSARNSVIKIGEHLKTYMLDGSYGTKIYTI